MRLFALLMSFGALTGCSAVTDLSDFSVSEDGGAVDGGAEVIIRTDCTSTSSNSRRDWVISLAGAEMAPTGGPLILEVSGVPLGSTESEPLVVASAVFVGALPEGEVVLRGAIPAGDFVAFAWNDNNGTPGFQASSDSSWRPGLCPTGRTFVAANANTPFNPDSLSDLPNFVVRSLSAFSADIGNPHADDFSEFAVISTDTAEPRVIAYQHIAELPADGVRVPLAFPSKNRAGSYEALFYADVSGDGAYSDSDHSWVFDLEYTENEISIAEHEGLNQTLDSPVFFHSNQVDGGPLTSFFEIRDSGRPWPITYNR